jgi:phage I-like protein
MQEVRQNLRRGGASNEHISINQTFGAQSPKTEPLKQISQNYAQRPPFQLSKFNEIKGMNNKEATGSYSVINARLSRGSNFSQSQDNEVQKKNQYENTAEENYSDACSAVDLSHCEGSNAQSDQDESDQYITAAQMQAMLLEQNRRHEEQMRKQQEMFQAQLEQHKSSSSLNVMDNSKAYANSF